MEVKSLILNLSLKTYNILLYLSKYSVLVCNNHTFIIIQTNITLLTSHIFTSPQYTKILVHLQIKLTRFTFIMPNTCIFSLQTD